MYKCLQNKKFNHKMHNTGGRDANGSFKSCAA